MLALELDLGLGLGLALVSREMALFDLLPLAEEASLRPGRRSGVPFKLAQGQVVRWEHFGRVHRLFAHFQDFVCRLMPNKRYRFTGIVLYCLDFLIQLRR